jgi:hypothetical protein
MIRAEIDQRSRAEFSRLMGEFRRATDKGVKDCMLELGRAGGKQLAQKVPPFGISAAVGKKFEKSIAKQVDRAVKAANVGTSNPGTAAQEHEARRDSRGQVPKDLRTRGQRVADPIPVRDKERLIDEKQAAAGLAKAGWIRAALALGGGKLSGVARWITRHQGRGTGKLEKRAATLTNSTPWIRRLQPENLIQDACKAAYRNTARQMQRILDKIKV